MGTVPAARTAFAATTAVCYFRFSLLTGGTHFIFSESWLLVLKEKTHSIGSISSSTSSAFDVTNEDFRVIRNPLNFETSLISRVLSRRRSVYALIDVGELSYVQGGEATSIHKIRVPRDGSGNGCVDVE